MSSGRIDIEVIGVSAVQRHRVAAGATRFYAGEPLNVDGGYTTGVISVNTVTQAADATPVIDAAGSNAFFVGISAQDATVNNAGTVLASYVDVVEVIPNFTRMRGKAETITSCDTLSELIGLLFDVVLWDSATISGVFQIDDSATADTSGLQIRGGVWERSMLDVIVDFRAMRTELTA